MKMLSRGHCVALIYGTIMLIYTSPLLLTRTSGNWDFWYIWDDRVNFVNNKVLHSSLDLQTLYEMFTMVKLNVYEPFGWLLKLVVVQTVGLDAWWIRMVSVVVHFGAGFVLAKVSALVLDLDYKLTALKHQENSRLELRKRSRQSRLHFYSCCVSAAVFMVHPLHVEVVAWPSAQPYTLAALFGCSALFVHIECIHQRLNKLVGENGDDRTAQNGILLSAVLGDGGMTATLVASGLYLCALLSKSASLLLLTGFFLIDLWVYLQLSLLQKTLGMKELGLYAARRLPPVAILLIFISVTAFSNSDGELPDMVYLSVEERLLKALRSPVWVVRSFVWPSQLRPHYQVQPGDFNFANSECLLSVTTTISVFALTIWNVRHRGVSKHALALAFFFCMLTPVSGVIQHGLITSGANRYAYLPTIITVPYCGWAVAHWLFGGSSLHDEKQRLIAPAWDTPERKMPHSSQSLKKAKRVVNNPIHRSSGVYGWSMFCLLTGTLLSISTNLLTQWRNEDTLFQYSLRVDPSDWKIYGQRAEFLMHARRCTSDDTECRHLWILASEFSPRGTLKSELYRLHLRVALRDVDGACDGYISLAKEVSGSCSVHNNAAVCFATRGMLDQARHEFSRAAECPDIEYSMMAHAKNSRDFDKWEADRMRAGADNIPGFTGSMTY